jgi:hypothetical protein
MPERGARVGDRGRDRAVVLRAGRGERDVVVHDRETDVEERIRPVPVLLALEDRLGIVEDGVRGEQVLLGCSGLPEGGELVGEGLLDGPVGPLRGRGRRAACGEDESGDRHREHGSNVTTGCSSRQDGGRETA